MLWSRQTGVVHPLLSIKQLVRRSRNRPALGSPVDPPTQHEELNFSPAEMRPILRMGSPGDLPQTSPEALLPRMNAGLPPKNSTDLLQQIRARAANRQETGA